MPGGLVVSTHAGVFPINFPSIMPASCFGSKLKTGTAREGALEPAGDAVSDNFERVGIGDLERANAGDLGRVAAGGFDCGVKPLGCRPGDALRRARTCCSGGIVPVR